MKQTKAKTPLSVGYTVPADGQIPFVDLISRYRDAIGEVYFAFPGISSGRSPFGQESPYNDYDALNILTEDLVALTQMGVDRNLLFNASCGGADCMSLQHEREVLSILDFLFERGIGPTGITTTSPVTAEIIKRNAPEIQVRASVNMRIDSIKGVQYVEHLFDSFCICRDINRDLDALGRLTEYLHKQGKTCSILVNSGCLRKCSMQSFHDNAVSHELEIRSKANLSWARPAGCREFFSTPLHHVDFLQNTWIRPEDLHHYDGMVDLFKIATRMHFLPAVVIDAYANRSYHGNLADLFEPGHGPLFAPFVVDNDRFPEDWFEKTTSCNKDCRRCGYCRSVKEKVFVNSEM
ncbi:MAG: hypothetical protein E7580_04580 [Ruminococcaceae bacterium]|nr:hypothetical protein [Oscillospiraceae bacterium]